MSEKGKIWDERPPLLRGMTTSVETGHGKMYVTLNRNEEGALVEVFARIDRRLSEEDNGYLTCDLGYLEGLARMISISLQHSIPVESIVRQLRWVSCCPLVGQNKSPVDAIAKVLEEAESDAKG